MTAAERIYQRMTMDNLRQLARQDDKGHTDEAARVFIDRLIDLEIELRVALAHERPGWHPSSPGFGDGTGSSTKMFDAMLNSYVYERHPHDWHGIAHRALSMLSSRARLAVLIRAVKLDGRRQGWRSAKYDDIANNLGHFAQELGWPAVCPLPPITKVIWKLGEDGKRHRHETSEPAFKSGQAIKWAAQQGRVELLAMAKAGVIQ